MGRRMISTTVYMREDQRIALRDLHVATGVAEARMVRDALDMYLNEKRAAGTLSVPAVSSPARVGQRHAADFEIERVVERTLRKMLAAGPSVFALGENDDEGTPA